jgi:Kinesin motor domain
LAGSEKSTEDLERRKEGAYINRSLLTLGTVISKLTEKGEEHIPFRDSKLTRLLQKSLSGNSKICVVATISPVLRGYEESINTLKFAARVKKIISRPQEVSQLDDKVLLEKYKTEVEHLRTKLSESHAMSNKAGIHLSTSIPAGEKRMYDDELLEARLV